MRSLLFMVLLVLLVTGGCSQRSQPLPASQFAITNVTILDGRGGEGIAEAAVVVADGRLQYVGPVSGADLSGMTEVIDGGGGYLLPGFIDMHAHLLVPRCDGSFDRQVSGEMIGQLLDFGITSIRSPGNPTIEGLAFRDQLNAGKARGPRAMASAEILNDPQMTPAQIADYVREALPYRPDYFKFHSRFPPASVAALVESAHASGVPVIGHLQATSTFDALDIGVDHVTHAVDWSPAMLRPERREAYAAARRDRGPIKARLDWLDLLDLQSPQVRAAVMALGESGVSLDPTLVAYDSKFRDPASARYRQNPQADRIPAMRSDWEGCPGIAEDWTQADYDRWGELWPKLLAYVKLLHEGGVLLTTGSDITNPWVIPGESLHQEMGFLVEAGIPPIEVLRMSGENAARAMGRREIGVIEQGRRADLVLLRQDPRRDIGNTRSIAWVMQGGVKVAGPLTANP